jgi:penicillin-binding protein 1A
VRQVIKANRSRGVRQAALVALDGEGRVRAMIGGVDYADNQFNRAVEAKRQAGSAFKPFVYLTAMSRAARPTWSVNDGPIKIGNWAPRNYTGSFSGQMTLSARWPSRSTPWPPRSPTRSAGTMWPAPHAVWASAPRSRPALHGAGRRRGEPLEMAKAYAPFSNGGLYAAPYGIERIRTRCGQVLYERRPSDRAPVVNNPGPGPDEPGSARRGDQRHRHARLRPGL